MHRNHNSAASTGAFLACSVLLATGLSPSSAFFIGSAPPAQSWRCRTVHKTPPALHVNVPELAQPKSSPSILFAAPSSPSSSSSLDDHDENKNSWMPGGVVQRRDLVAIASHVAGCAVAAAALSTYEDYDCTNLKPQRATLRYDWGIGTGVSGGGGVGGGGTSMIGSATRGLGWGESDRDAASYRERFGEQAGREVPSYNEVMLRHRADRVPRWRRSEVEESSASASAAAIGDVDVRDSVGAIYDALRDVSDLKVMANEYEWDDMEKVLRGPVLTSDLEIATSTLRAARSHLTDDARETVGFDWGSCAWRHCGAAADAQESLAELRNSLGLFEPFECLFVLDIVERSLRDVLDVIPAGLHPKGRAMELGPYVPYQSQGDGSSDGYYGNEGDADGMTIDVDFLGALSALRNDLSSE